VTPVGRCFADTSHSLKQKQETRSREEFLQSTTEQRAVERMFENARQACSALAQHSATRAFGFEGQTATEVVRVLHEGAVIDSRLTSWVTDTYCNRQDLLLDPGNNTPPTETDTVDFVCFRAHPHRASDSMCARVSRTTVSSRSSSYSS